MTELSQLGGSIAIYDRVAKQAMREAAADIQQIERDLHHIDLKGTPGNLGSAMGLRVRQANIGLALAQLVSSYLAVHHDEEEAE